MAIKKLSKTLPVGPGMRRTAQIFFEGGSLRGHIRALHTLFAARGSGLPCSAELGLYTTKLQQLLYTVAVLAAETSPAPFTASVDQLAAEATFYRYYPGYISRSALQDPVNWLRDTLYQKALHSCCQQLRDWALGIVRTDHETATATFRRVQDLIGVTWLIANRNKAHTKPASENPSLFGNTWPLSLNDEERLSPLRVIAEFFSNWDILCCRQLLKEWFKHALATGSDPHWCRSVNLFFFFGELTRLLEATYMLFGMEGETGRRQSASGASLMTDVAPCSTSLGERRIEFDDFSKKDAALLADLSSLETMRRIRYGMYQWMVAAESKGFSITELDEVCMYPQYECLDTLVTTVYRYLQSGLKDREGENHASARGH